MALGGQLAQLIRPEPAQEWPARVLRQHTLGAQPHEPAASASFALLSAYEVAPVGG